MLGKVSEATCRLNIYVHKPDGHTKSYTADAWGFGQISGKKCLVVRDLHSQVKHVLGAIMPRSSMAREDIALMMRARVVEEGVVSTHRQEFTFILDEVDEFTRNKVVQGPLIEPARLVGQEFRL
jgi:hypothetical protein